MVRKVMCATGLFLGLALIFPLASPRRAEATKTGVVSNATCIDSDCSNCFISQTVVGGKMTACAATKGGVGTDINTCHTTNDEGNCWMTDTAIAACPGSVGWACAVVSGTCGGCKCAPGAGKAGAVLTTYACQ
jgi:hypothetical protein